METGEVTLITHVNTKVEAGRMTRKRVLTVMQGGSICPMDGTNYKFDKYSPTAKVFYKLQR
jgi:hypothetical protein